MILSSRTRPGDPLVQTDLLAFVTMLVEQKQCVKHRMSKASAEDLVALQQYDGFVVSLKQSLRPGEA